MNTHNAISQYEIHDFLGFLDSSIYILLSVPYAERHGGESAEILGNRFRLSFHDDNSIPHLFVKCGHTL